MKHVELKAFLIFVTLVLGAIGYGLTRVCAVREILAAIESDSDALQSTAGILSSYAFTVGGFLSTICAFLLGLLDYPLMRVYRGRGYFGVLILFHGLTMAVLAALFVVSIGLLVKAEWLDLAAVLTFISLCQFALITAISVRLTLRAQAAPPSDSSAEAPDDAAGGEPSAEAAPGKSPTESIQPTAP